MPDFIIDPIPVPDVDDPGTEEESAIVAIMDAYLQPQVLYEASDTIPLGQVIRQDPAPGTEVEANSTVTIWVSAVIEETAETGTGGTVSRPRRRKYVSIDDRLFEVRNAEEARQLLAQAKERVAEVAQRDAQVAIVKPGKPKPTPPKVRVTADIASSLKDVRTSLQSTYQRAFAQAVKNQRSLAQDDDDEVIGFLF